MATTKIWSIRGRVESVINYAKDHEKTENPRYTNAQIQALEDVIEYAANEDKTERHFFVSGINCNETCAKRQFENVKRRFDKSDGIIAFHAYQSFAEGETTPAEAHRIGQNLAQELWGDRFQVIVATHTNSHCLHNHMVINSVSFKDGKKFHADSKFYRRMKETSDRICMEHGLSVVENPGRGSERVYEAKMSDAGKPTRYNLARMAVDEVISKSHNIKEFELQMRKQGYSVQLSQNKKYWTVTPKGMSKAIRLVRLGDDYSNERILERIRNNDAIVRFGDFYKPSVEFRQYRLVTRKDRIKKVRGLRGLYLRYCYELGYLPKYKQRPQKVHYLLRDDILKCERISEQIRLLGENGIETTDQLSKFTEDRKGQINEFCEKRGELKRQARKVLPEDEKGTLQKSIAELSTQLKVLRKEVRLAEDVLKTHEKKEKAITEIDKEELKRKEHERW